MLSILTVRINEFTQSVSNGAKITLLGNLYFNYYERKEVVEKNITFIATSTAVLPIVEGNQHGTAIGYIDTDDTKTPIFKIQQFIPSSTSVNATEYPTEVLVV